MVKHSLASCNLTVHFDSHRWAFDIALAGYFTTLLERIGRVHLNWLVSLHGRDLNIVNLIEVGALGKPFKKLNICLLHLHVFLNFKVSSSLVQKYLLSLHPLSHLTLNSVHMGSCKFSANLQVSILEQKFFLMSWSVMVSSYSNVKHASLWTVNCWCSTRLQFTEETWAFVNHQDSQISVTNFLSSECDCFGCSSRPWWSGDKSEYFVLI